MADPQTPDGRSAIARSLDRSLLMLGVAGLTLGVIYLALTLPVHEQWWAYALAIVAFWTFIAAGILAWQRRPSNGMGALIVFGGFSLYVGMLADTGVPILAAVGVLCATLLLAVTLHLLHAFPSGRLRGRFSRATVIGGYLVCTVLQAPLFLFDGNSPSPELVIADRPDFVALGGVIQQVAGLLVTLATVVVLASRLRRSDAVHRRVLIPLFGYGIFAVLFGPFGPMLLTALTGMAPDQGVIVQLLVYMGIPIAFALSVLRGGFARSGELQELGTWLGGSDGTHPELRSALARTLGDDSLRVLFWVPERDVFVDADGVPTRLPQGDGRAAVDVELDGRLIGAIEYDSDLIAEDGLVRMAGRIVAIAVERDRLTAELLASRRELLRSRARLVETAERERRRIARDLHDGLQVRLVLLGMHAGALARAEEASDGFRRDATALREGIDSAAGELRRFVHAVMPSTLIEQGLAAAAEDLVDRMPVPTALELGLGEADLPQTIESAAYFVIAEGLANALKHAEATACAVRVIHDGDVLSLEVGDNGVGGAAAPVGLRDRIEAVGGVLKVDSPAGGGTTLRVELPCEW
ncbi:MAG: sensor histidine kinase [Actinobacteria bacterium]|nr:sensor histidine kinase [Actinomycetota bacterium]